MENIIEPTFDFNFSKLNLGSPVSTSGGTYFTKILYDNRPLYVQTPKSLTKQGFVKSGKKIHADLMFTNFDNMFIDWLERLQNKCEDVLYEKGQTWFETKLDKDDIETAFTSAIKVFKSGKNYLIRVNTKPNVKIYSETNALVELENVTNDTNLISILEIQGIKFTSKFFQIEIELKQSMIVSSDPFLDKCFIKNPNKSDHENIGKNLGKDDMFSECNVIEQRNDKKNATNNLTSNEILDDIVAETINEIHTNEIHTSTKPATTDKINLEINELSFENMNDEIIQQNEIPQNEIPQNKITQNEMPQDGLVDVTNDIFCNDDESIKLKNRNQVYNEIYQKAKDKVKELKSATIVAFMELKNIKNMYMLDDIYDSDADIEDLNEINLDKF